MSKLDRYTSNIVSSSYIKEPLLFDFVFIQCMKKCGFNAEADKYQESLFEPVTGNEKLLLERRINVAYDRAVFISSRLTDASVYFTAIGVELFRMANLPPTDNQLAYLIRIRKELKRFIDATEMDNFTRVLLNGRINNAIKGIFPNYVPKGGIL